MSFSAKRCAYSDMPSFSSQSAICCIAAHPCDGRYGVRAKISDRRSDVNSPLSLGCVRACKSHGLGGTAARTL